MLKGVLISSGLGVLVSVGVVSLLPLLGSSSDGDRGPSGAPKAALPGAASPGGCCNVLAPTALQPAGVSQSQGRDASDNTTPKDNGCCCDAKDKGQCSPCAVDTENRPRGEAIKVNPDRQIVVRVHGLTCPAVKGLGCGHRFAPVLARLNKISGVEKCFSNRTGTMLRIAVAPSADRDRVAALVCADLARDNRKPVLLTAEERKAILEKEEWRTPEELSAIEFRTLALHRVKTFAESAKLDRPTTERLMKIARLEWDRITQDADCCKKAEQSADWLAHCKQFATAMPDRAKELLGAAQVERLRQVLTCRFYEAQGNNQASASAGNDHTP